MQARTKHKVRPKFRISQIL